jgi:HK97 family phage prohead protease
VSDHGSPPRENLIRALPAKTECRDGEGDQRPILFGHFSRFNEWTEIDSFFEGRFLERISPNAYTKTFKERRDQLRVLFQHGKDPMVGDKPIAEIERLEAQDEGAYHESRLLDGVPELIVSGLRAGQYGQSFRMEVVKEDFNERPDKSDVNPLGLPERTINEIRLHEFGPVTFPAYPNTTPGLRSLTDRFIFEWLERNATEARSLISAQAIHLAAFPAAETALPETPEAAPGTSAPVSRDRAHNALIQPREPGFRSALDITI